MFNLVHSAFIFAFVLTTSASAKESIKPNDIVDFLAGKWDNVSFEISDGKDIKREAYPETMVLKHRDTLTITAHGFRDGKDVSKDMQLILQNNDIMMAQGDFKASGKREGNKPGDNGKNVSKQHCLCLQSCRGFGCGLDVSYVRASRRWSGTKCPFRNRLPLH
jgi:hypothetical protein